MKRTLAAIAAALITTAVASAQSYPGDAGLGTQRGIEQVNGSGQVGTVTLFRRGANTRVVVEMHGTSPGRIQSTRLYRGAACDSLSASPAYVLADMHGGTSQTTLHADEGKLLSGNYNVVVFSNNKAGSATTACGHLY